MKIVMPKLGLTMIEGTLTRWHKAEGDVVQPGDILFEFESEKSALEYECPASGVLSQILVGEGQTVPCGTPVAALEVAPSRSGAARPSEQTAPVTRLPADVTSPTNQPSNHPVPKGPRGANQPSIHPIVATPAARRRARELGINLSAVAGRGPEGRIQVADVEAAATQGIVVPEVPRTATPVARRVASELGVDWRQVSGSGPGGRVVKDDVLQTVPPASPARGASRKTIPLSGVRGVVARRMSESAFTAPHVTLFTEANATALMEARAQLNAELAGSAHEGQTLKISYNTLLIAILARALREHPILNACLAGEEIRLYDEVHIALAVDTDDGLLAPVVRYADQLDLVSLQRVSDELIQRALAGKSLPDDLVGGTFTLTNLGAYEIDGFTPIINQPQAAILGVGRILPRAVAVGNEVAVRQMMTLSLSFDHRIVDGGPAARFLQRVKGLVERPFALVIRV